MSMYDCVRVSASAHLSGESEINVRFYPTDSVGRGPGSVHVSMGSPLDDLCLWGSPMDVVGTLSDALAMVRDAITEGTAQAEARAVVAARRSE